MTSQPGSDVPRPPAAEPTAAERMVPEQIASGAILGTGRAGVSGPVLDGVEQWTHIGLGVVGFALEQSASHLASGVADTADAEVADAEPKLATAPDGRPRPLPVMLSGALLGLALAGQSRLFDAIAALEERLSVVVAVGTARGPVAWANRRLARALEPWDRRWQLQQQQNLTAAEAFLAAIGPSALDELLGRIDVERIVDRVPMEYAANRVDVNSIITDVANELRYGDLLREGTNAILREGSEVLATTTADVVRGQVSAVSRLTSLPFLRRGPVPQDQVTEGPAPQGSPAKPPAKPVVTGADDSAPVSPHAPARLPARARAKAAAPLEGERK